jgi:hypothetical protein
MNNQQQLDAVVKFFNTWGSDTLGDIATSLTCTEAEAMADLLRAFGHERTAEWFIKDHAAGDDEGDLHYEGEEA